MSTVVYQESANHFTNMDQAINNCQIETIKYFHTPGPDANGDYNGQLGLSVLDPKDPKFYVWSSNPAHGGWNPITLNVQEIIPNLAQLDEENNFTKYKQTINGNQITSVKRGTVDADHTMIGNDGQIYINDNNEKVWISSGGFWLEITGAELDGVAKLATPNDFTNTEQTITGHPIVSVKYSSTTPDKDINGYHVPKRLGSLYVMIPDSESVDQRVRIWSSWEPHAGVYKWAEVSESPFNAKTNIENTFTKTQKYNSTRVAETGKKAYLSTVISNGVNKDPNDYGKNPDHNGQMLLGWREHTPEGGGLPIASDLMVHFGVNNTWLPLNSEPIDETKLAKLDDINQFTEINQYIGAAAQKRQINTCRVKYDNISPALDTTFPAYKNGEEVVWINPDLGEVSVWKAISTSEMFTPTHNVWKMIWSSKDTTVRTNEENIFSKLQYLDTRSDGSEKRPFIVASRGSSVPHAEITAQVVGQLYLEQYSDTGTGAGKQFRLHFARELGNTSWECVYDSMFETNIANDLATINNELDNVAASAGQNASDITTALAELEELKTEVGGFDGRITTVENVVGDATADIVDVTERIGTIESWRNLTIEPALETLEIDSTAAKVSLQNHEGRIVALEAKDTQHTESIKTAHDHAQDAHDEIALHAARITSLEDAPIPDTVVQTNKANIMTQGLTLQTKPLVIKDTNFPRLELWMDAQHEDTNIMFGTVELSEGQFKLVGKNKNHFVQTTVLVPVVGESGDPATLISDKCSKFTDLEAFKVSATGEIAGHETRIATLEDNTGYDDTAIVERIEDVEAKAGMNDTIITGLTWGNEALHNRLTVLETGGGGVTEQNLADTPHMIKGSRVAEGFFDLEGFASGGYDADEVQNYTHFRLANTNLTYLYLPRIVDAPTDEPSYPVDKIITVEKIGDTSASLSTNQAHGAVIRDMNGRDTSRFILESNTKVKLLTKKNGASTIYQIIDIERTDLISELSQRVAELEAKVNNLNIWTLSMNASEVS